MADGGFRGFSLYNFSWERLGDRVRAYKGVLMAAMEVHKFNRDVDETNQRIGEKAALLGGDGAAKDLGAVERLLRAQDQVERFGPMEREGKYNLAGTCRPSTAS